MHDLMIAARAIHDESRAVAGNGEQAAWLLDAVDAVEAGRVMADAIAETHDRFAGALMAYGPSRANDTYLVATAIRVGVELGIAAERMRL